MSKVRVDEDIRPVSEFRAGVASFVKHIQEPSAKAWARLWTEMTSPKKPVSTRLISHRGSLWDCDPGDALPP